MRVVVAFSPSAGVVDLTELALPAAACVADALRASGLATRHPDVDLHSLRIGIWGALCERESPLREGDRVEVYRPLRVDPKQARRERSKAHQQRVKAQETQREKRAPKRR